MVCLGCFRGVIVINISFTSSHAVILAARVPKISFSPLLYRLISKVQGDSKAAHLPSRPLSPNDCINYSKVECLVSTLTPRETNNVKQISNIRSRARI